MNNKSLKCLWCKHEWEPRVKKPVRCPNCFRPSWNKPKGEPR